MFDLLGSNFNCTGPDVVRVSMLVFILQERESGLNAVYKLQAQSSNNLYGKNRFITSYRICNTCSLVVYVCLFTLCMCMYDQS